MTESIYCFYECLPIGKNQHQRAPILTYCKFNIGCYFWHACMYIYLLKDNNRNTRTSCEICSKLTIKAPRRQWRRCGVFIVNFEHISQLVLVFLLLTLNM